MIKKIVNMLLIFSIIFIVVGCGSNSSDDNDDLSNRDNKQTIKLRGQVGKGKVVVGSVTAYDLDNNILNTAQIVDGIYAMDIDNYEGNIKLIATIEKYHDEILDKNIATNPIELKAYSTISKIDTNISITPITNSIADMIKELKDDTNISAVNTYIANILGIGQNVDPTKENIIYTTQNKILEDTIESKMALILLGVSHKSNLLNSDDKEIKREKIQNAIDSFTKAIITKIAHPLSNKLNKMINISDKTDTYIKNKKDIPIIKDKSYAKPDEIKKFLQDYNDDYIPHLNISTPLNQVTNIWSYYSPDLDINSSSAIKDIKLINAPDWLSVDKKTMLIKAVVPTNSKRKYSSIKAKITNEENITKEITFNLEIKDPINIAPFYTSLTQGRGYSSVVTNLVDNNLSTYQQTRASSNWLEINFAKNTVIKKIELYRHASHRPAGTKLYICNEKIENNITKLDTNCTKVATLTDKLGAQVWQNSTNIKGETIYLKGDENKAVYLAEMKVYGTLAPTLKALNTVLPVDVRVNDIDYSKPIFTIKGFSSTNNDLIYDLNTLEPFTINQKGQIYITSKPLIQKLYKIDFSISDGTNRFNDTLKLNLKTDFANRYAKATQEAKEDFYYYAPAYYAIDNNSSTRNHTRCEAGKNWLQVELPDGITINNIIVKSPVAPRIYKAKIYLLDKSHKLDIFDSSLYSNDIIDTLRMTTEKQSIKITKNQNRRFIVIVANGNNCLNVSDVEVYGEPTKKPIFLNDKLNITIDKWHNKIEPILEIKALDYQNDNIIYKIEDNLPFKIDNKGKIYVDGILREKSYDLNITISDQINTNSKIFTIDTIDTPIVKKIKRVNNNQPEISGYLPNIYKQGDSLYIEIDGIKYSPTINTNGTWSIEQGVITSLFKKKYDIKIIVNDIKIVYKNYFEVYAKRYQKFLKTIDFAVVPTINIEIESQTITPLATGKFVKADSIFIQNDNGVIKLINNSYRTIKSIIGSYKDENGNTQYAKLLFSQNIAPYSTNILNQFEHSDTIKIYNSAGSYNLEISFGSNSDNCGAATNSKQKKCTPTNKNDTIYSNTARKDQELSEQQLLTIILSTFHHFYNTVNSYPSLKAWVYQESYKGVDFNKTEIDQEFSKFLPYLKKNSFDKQSYLNYHFMHLITSGHKSKLLVTRYIKGIADGVAANPGLVSLFGFKNTSAWASLWEGNIDADINDYDILHHELAHTFGFHHDSGMTYGYSRTLKKAINRFYTTKQAPVWNAPLYFFSASNKNNNKVQLTFYKTDLSINDDISIDFFSAAKLFDDDIIIKNEPDDKDNQMTLIKKDSIFTRLIVRAYGNNSKEIASKIIDNRYFIKPTLLDDKNNIYYILSKDRWLKPYAMTKAYLPFKITNIIKSKYSSDACRATLGSKARIAYKKETDTIPNFGDFIRENFKIKKLLTRIGNWDEQYIRDFSLEDDNNNWGKMQSKNFWINLNADEYNIICIIPK